MRFPRAITGMAKALVDAEGASPPIRELAKAIMKADATPNPGAVPEFLGDSAYEPEGIRELAETALERTAGYEREFASQVLAALRQQRPTVGDRAAGRQREGLQGGELEQLNRAMGMGGDDVPQFTRNELGELLVRNVGPRKAAALAKKHGSAVVFRSTWGRR